VSVTNRIKKERTAAYGMTGQPVHVVELDHLASLGLGGAPADPLNLGPEPYDGSLNAHDKDKVEDAAHRLVCSGHLTLADAQRKTATDWVGFYHEIEAEGEIPQRRPSDGCMLTP
jgi:hypothetical protein